MNVPRTHDSSCDLPVQSTLHIPTSHTFIPFQQFSITDGSGIRNPADDNNNKTAVPVVSVVTAVSSLCPALPVVSMQQTAQLAQAVVTPTIIPAVITPMTVQTANCLAPTATMTVAKTLNISSHISLPIQHTVGISTISMTPHTTGPKQHTNGTNTNSITITHQNTPGSVKKTTNISNNSGSLNNSTPNSVKTSGTTNTTKTASSQNVSTDQNEDLVKPVFKDGELVLEVECGQNKAVLYLSKLCQGSKGPCISFQSSWLTPNEFQFVSGRETAKDWKRSIRHHGKSLKLLLAKGILNVHPTMCDCDGCRQGATLTRKGEKRRIPNGERKTRKPSSNSSNLSSDGSSSGAFRPVGSSTLPAHSTMSGAAQAKPEVKRSAVDKPKIGDTATLSSQKEVGSKASFVKPINTQRPNSLNTSRDISKQKMSSLTAVSTSSLAPSPLTGATSTLPVANMQLNPSSFLSVTNQLQPFSTVATLTASSTATTLSASNSFLVATLHPQSLTAKSATSVLASASFPEQQTGCAPSNLVLSGVLSPNLPVNPLSLIQTSYVGSDHQESREQTTGDNSQPELDMSDDDDVDDDVDEDDEDDQYLNETAESQNADERSDDLDDDSDDENSVKSSKDSENNDSMSGDDHATDDSCNRASTGEEMIHNDTSITPAHVLSNDIKRLDNVRDCVDMKVETMDDNLAPTELTKHSEVSYSGIKVEEKHDLISEPLLPSHTVAAATLAVSTFSGMCSQPLSVATSSTNVKSEHIWVPPRLSPQGDAAHHIHRAHNSNNIPRSPSDFTHPDSGHIRGDDHATFVHRKDRDHPDISKKTDRPSLTKDSEHENTKAENKMPVTSSPKEFQSIERHLTPNCENGRHGVKGESSQIKLAYTGHTITNEKSARDREREDKHRQRVKEERNRKEREERNRKDREREDRREYERREEKETEKRRQEDKDRREVAKIQAEGSSNKEAAAVSGTVDLSRRPPGGVAEAAAFSDYMRMLAAGHGHSYISPTMSYMPTLLPFRPQETSIPTQFFHPMTAYSHQLNSLPKDPVMYQTAGGVFSNYGTSPFGPLHSLLQRPQYPTQQTILDYQRSLTAASAYPWPAAYPYFIHDVNSTSTSASSSSSSSSSAKRSNTEIEVAMEMNTKRMRLDGRLLDYSNPWDYFAAAASQHQHLPSMMPSLPCGLESANMAKTAEYLRKRYMDYGPQAAAYLSTFPEYARSAYHCACADHREDNIRMWSVEDVCKFLTSLDGCAVYSDHFREQRVTGRILALLTSDHLVKNMGMKMGPAVLLSEAVARKVQDSNNMANCEACRNFALSQPLHPMALPL